MKFMLFIQLPKFMIKYNINFNSLSLRYILKLRQTLTKQSLIKNYEN